MVPLVLEQRSIDICRKGIDMEVEIKITKVTKEASIKLDDVEIYQLFEYRGDLFIKLESAGSRGEKSDEHVSCVLLCSCEGDLIHCDNLVKPVKSLAVEYETI